MVWASFFHDFQKSSPLYGVLTVHFQLVKDIQSGWFSPSNKRFKR